MDATLAIMASVLQQLREWATGLPFWEQAALERIVGGGRFTEDDYEDVLRLLLEDGGLAPATPRAALTFPQPVLDATAASGRPVRLAQISDLRNVNALAEGQTLTFGPALTSIFGANGSGKSGYARVLGSACFTRGDRVVLGDVMRAAAPGVPIRATIDVADGDGAVTSIDYLVGGPHPALRCFYVFDTTSVRTHLTRSNTLSFSPAGLAHLTALADVTDELRKRLQSLIREKTRENTFPGRFEGPSVVVTALSTLGKDTDLAALRRLATLSGEEQAEREAVKAQIAALANANMQEALGPLRRLSLSLSLGQGALERAEAALSDATVDQVRAAIAAWRNAQAAAESHTLEQFRGGLVEGLGSPEWHKLAEAARALARAQPNHPYPHSGDPCLLCHRPLEPAQVAMLERLWIFLDGTATEGLRGATRELERLAHQLASVDLSTAEDAAAAALVKQCEPSALAALQEHGAALQSRREALVSALRARQDLPKTMPPAGGGASVLSGLVTTVNRQIAELEGKGGSEEFVALRERLVTLEHRARLGELLPELEAFVADCQWAARAGSPKVRGSTKHITSKYNELFAALVTDRYVELFQKTLTELNCPRRVKVLTKGQKGETRKQVVLETPEGAPPDGTPDKVLSEGEQRAVALADFLTEVALDDQSAGIILDDPVTSLDFEWKDTIARYVVGEAKRRQVIVFTHDLHFLHCLREEAEESKVPLASHWIEKREGTPGWVFLDNSPVVEKDYKSTKKVSDLLKRATAPGTPPDEQQRLLGDAFGALRTCYEAFVIFDLFGDVVRRFEERVSIERMKSVVIDPAIRDEVIEKVGMLSRYIQGHLHSDRFGAQKPTPDLLKRELESFEALRKRLKELKKASGAGE